MTSHIYMYLYFDHKQTYVLIKNKYDMRRMRNPPHEI